MKDLDEVKFSGEITSDGSTRSPSTSRPTPAGDCTGSIGLGGGTAEVLAKDGTNWFKPDEAFWRANAADSGATRSSRAVGDKWVLDTDSNFAQFCDLDAFFDNLFKARARARHRLQRLDVAPADKRRPELAESSTAGAAHGRAAGEVALTAGMARLRRRAEQRRRPGRRGVPAPGAAPEGQPAVGLVTVAAIAGRTSYLPKLERRRDGGRRPRPGLRPVGGQRATCRTRSARRGSTLHRLPGLRRTDGQPTCQRPLPGVAVQSASSLQISRR